MIILGDIGTAKCIRQNGLSIKNFLKTLLLLGQAYEEKGKNGTPTVCPSVCQQAVSVEP